MHVVLRLDACVFCLWLYLVCVFCDCLLVCVSCFVFVKLFVPVLATSIDDVLCLDASSFVDSSFVLTLDSS
jgi:hypothetical protein